VLCRIADEQTELADIVKRGAVHGTRLEPSGDAVEVVLDRQDPR
jgi:hypothetical protein